MLSMQLPQGWAHQNLRDLRVQRLQPAGAALTSHAKSGRRCIPGMQVRDCTQELQLATSGAPGCA